MKKLRIFFIFAVAFLGLTSVQISAQSVASGKNNVQGIEKQVMREILTLPNYDVFDAISFKVDNNIVYLYGNVVEPWTKKQAEKSVESIDGVREVVNNINVLPLSGFDNRTRYAVLNRVANSGGLYRYFLGANPSVRIIVNNGNVSLEGYVSNRGDANLANIMANSVPGVFSVKNNLIVESEMK